MNIEPLLDRHIDAIQSRLTNAELKWFQMNGKTLRLLYETPHDQLPSLLYSGKVGEMTSADLHRIKRELDRAHRQNIAEMSTLFRDLTAEVYETGQEMSREKGVEISNKTAYRQSVNPLLQGVFQSYAVLGMSTTINRDYRDTINKYVGQLVSAGDDRESYPSILRKTIRELTESGISTIDYASGRKQRMDSAVRRDLMGEFTQIVQGVQQKLAEELDSSGWEITAHNFPAKDHADVQGMVFTNEEFEKLQNHEPAVDIDGNIHHLEHRNIGQYNCGHMAMPFIIGISERAYSQEYLDRIQGENTVGVQWQGERISLYEGTQIQRQLENEIRHQRENLNALKPVRDADPRLEADYQKSRARLAELRNEYKQIGSILETHAIRMKWDRSYVPKGSTGNPAVPPFFQTNASIGAMATRFHVKTGMKTQYDSWHIREGSYVSGVTVMAKGTAIRDVDRLVTTYKLQNGSLTNPKDWYKVRGTGIVTDTQVERMAELHWYQCANIGKVEFKVKRYYN